MSEVFIIVLLVFFMLCLVAWKSQPVRIFVRLHDSDGSILWESDSKEWVSFDVSHNGYRITGEARVRDE